MYSKRLLCFLGLSLMATSFAKEEWPLLFSEDFSKGADAWKPTDPKNWRLTKEAANQVFELHNNESDYKPPHRSPFNFALREGLKVGDFELTAKLKTTTKSYGHRDMVLVFGYVDPAHFYYVHLGEKADEHANQIFIVNDAPRIKISTKSTDGTPWKEDHWHQVKIRRVVESGLIQVYFDDMEKPVMEATDKHFASGQVGIGSFDDTGCFDDISLRGLAVKP